MINSNKNLVNLQLCYAKVLSAETQLEALRAVVFAIASELELRDITSLKSEFYQVWHSNLTKQFDALSISHQSLPLLHDYIQKELASLQAYAKHP